MKFQDKDKEYFQSREKKADKIIVELENEGLDRNKKIKVLEVGCNHGFITFHIANKTKWDMYGGDVNEEHLNKYSWIKKKAKIEYLDATKMKFKDGTFDLVIYNHVIEHIPEWKKTIPEIHRVLKKGGLLYLATPNLHRKLVGPKVLLRKKKNVNNKVRIDNHMGFSIEELKNLLKQFKVVKILNKKHLTNSMHSIGKPVVRAIPSKALEKYAQTNVVIARK